ncbi:hypothetical protein ACO0K9_00190 [Undibacterium sp. Ji50W]|uniref:hypothetical protein n=1 Tax=Undibacterium sp. Ji50W TaxID=3413041 RepID=UPI003BF141DF
MSQIVRVAIDEDIPQLVWPPCCPKCGATGKLYKTTSRVGRVKSLRPNLLGGMTMKSDVLYLAFPGCEKHAQQTGLANALLEKSPLMHLIRLMMYMAAFFVLPVIMRPKAFIADLSWYSLVPVFGVLGIASIVWARKVSSVWPVRFDPDMDVIIIRFLDEDYAVKFRLANRKATSNDLTDAPPWYQRALIWKVLVICLLIAFMSKLAFR